MAVDNGTGKPVVTLAALGNVDHGKTTLAAAMTLVLSRGGRSRPVPYDQIDAAPGTPQGSLPGNASRVTYDSDGRTYLHVDCPAHADHVKGLIGGAERWDAALLVVSAADGPMPQTREHLMLARRLGVPRVVVFMNKVDMVTDPNLLGLVEGEIREVLASAEFPGAEAPIVKGSALQALRCGCGSDACPKCRPVLDLVAAMDRYIPAPAPDSERPLLFVCDEVIGVPGGGAVLSGQVRRGRVQPGQRVTVLGAGAGRPAEVVGVESEAGASGADAGARARLVLAGVNRDAVARGCVVAEPGSIAGRTSFRAEIYWMGSEEGGRQGAVAGGYRASFLFWGSEVAGTVTLPADRAEVRPGEHADVRVALEAPVALEEGLRFAVCEGGRTVGAGAITEIVE